MSNAKMPAMAAIELSNPIGLAVADLVMLDNGQMLMTRINVPSAHRGKGVGSRLLGEVTLKADEARCTVVLEVSPSGDMNRDDLISWFSRNGFSVVDGTGNTMIRKPM